MKKFIFGFIFFFFFLQVVPLNLSSVYAQDEDEVIKNLEKTASCGVIGAACCEAEPNLPNVRIKSPNFAGLGSVINVLLSPLNKILSLTDPVMDWLENRAADFTNRTPCSEGVPSDAKNVSSCVCLRREAFQLGKLCTGISNAGERQKCVQCSGHGVWTGIGCIDFKLEDFVTNRVLGFGIGLAGGVALLCIIYSSYLLQLSQGNPERIKKAREYLTSCIVGLLLIIFSIFILRLIGVNIFGIPGFS